MISEWCCHTVATICSVVPCFLDMADTCTRSTVCSHQCQLQLNGVLLLLVLQRCLKVFKGYPDWFLDRIKARHMH